MLKCTHAGVTWNGWSELCKYHSPFGRPGDTHSVKTSVPRRWKVKHSGEQSLCHITISWERVKQGADRQGSVGFLARTKKDRDERPGREEWELRASGWGWRLTGSRRLYPAWVRHALIGSAAIPADSLHPGRAAPCFVYFDLIIGLAVLVSFLRPCKIQRTENITQRCTHSSAHTNWRYICQQTADICTRRRLHSHPSTHIVNVWAQMQTHILAMHRSRGVDGCWRLKVYSGWLANYAHIMRGSACQF